MKMKEIVGAQHNELYVHKVTYMSVFRRIFLQLKLASWEFVRNIIDIKFILQ